jgi:hypothetical protein
MQNRKKQDRISVNVITPENDIKAVSKDTVGNAAEDPNCIYTHERHAVGSKIKNDDGSELICTDNSSWQNSKKNT